MAGAVSSQGNPGNQEADQNLASVEGFNQQVAL